MFNWKHWITASCFALLSASSAFATLNATVTAPQTLIYDFVDGKFKPIMPLPKGQALKVGDQPKGPWYRCVVPGSNPVKAGWVPARDITVGAATPRKDKGKSPKDAEKDTGSHWAVGLFYDITFPSPSNLQNAANLIPGLSLGTGYGIELVRRSSESFYFGLRVDLVQMSGKASSAVTGLGDLTYSGTAIPIVPFANYNFIAEPSFTLGLLLGAGLSPSTSFSVSDGTSTYTGSAMALVLPVEITSEVVLGESFEFMFEAGYRFIKPLSSPVIASGYALGSDFTSPVVGLGIGYRF